ncbi:Golgi transport complex subunit 6 [Malassezia sp. CBS 17886]|nr:Golgi transport complex subunit 6 [Malassezia sp. CBS 17886]
MATLERMYAPSDAEATPVDVARLRKRMQADMRDRESATTAGLCGLLAAVESSLDGLHRELQMLSGTCSVSLARMDEAADAARPLLEYAGALNVQIAMAHTHEDMAESLLARLTLTPDEYAVLAGAEACVDARLFGVMDRLQQILDETLVLMDAAGGDASGVARDAEHPGGGDRLHAGVPAAARAARDVRARTMALLDAALRRTQHWVVRELRSMGDGAMDVSDTVQAAMARVAARDDLFRTALEALVEARDERLPAAFKRALTHGGGPPSFLPRPIEMHAHDTVRYVSDILAWMHQTLAKERELLVAVLARLEEGAPGEDAREAAAPAAHGVRGRRIGTRHGGLDLSVDLDASGSLGHLGSAPFPSAQFQALVRAVLDRSLRGCCHPAKRRIVQTLQVTADPDVVMRLYQVLHFYRVTLEHTIGGRAALSQMLDELLQAACTRLRALLQQYAEQHLRAVGDAPVAHAADAIAAATQLLRTLLRECEGAAAGGDGAADAPLEPLLDTLLGQLADPLAAFARALAGHTRARLPAPTSWTQAWLGLRAAPAARPDPLDAPSWHADVLLLNAAGPILALLEPLGAAALPRCDALRADVRLAAHRIRDAHELAPSTGVALREFLAMPSLLIPPSRLQELEKTSLSSAVHQSALLRLARTYTHAMEVPGVGTDASLPAADEVYILLDVPRGGAATPDMLLELGLGLAGDGKGWDTAEGGGEDVKERSDESMRRDGGGGGNEKDREGW